MIVVFWWQVPTTWGLPCSQNFKKVKMDGEKVKPDFLLEEFME
jgi:hypothetical protein